MSALVFAFWLLNAALDTAGQLALKAAAGAEGDGLARWRAMAGTPWLWLGVACYLGEFFAWLAFLSLLPLSKGVLLGSINIVAVMLAGRLLFRERLTPYRTAGMALVAGGVALVGMG